MNEKLLNSIRHLTFSHLFLSLALLLMLPSLILPVYLYTVGINCKAQIEESTIERTRCPTPIISHSPGTQEYQEFVFKYKSLMSEYFTGGKMALTSGLLLLYELVLLGAIICMLTGNAARELWRVVVTMGLIFLDLILAVMAFTFPLQELTEMDSTFVLNSLVIVPALIGIGIYYFVFYRFQRRQDDFESRARILDDQLPIIYENLIPMEVQAGRSRIEDNLNLTATYMKTNFLYSFLLDRLHTKAARDLSQIEENGSQRIDEATLQFTSRIKQTLADGFASKHLSLEETTTIFRKLAPDALASPVVKEFLRERRDNPRL